MSIPGPVLEWLHQRLELEYIDVNRSFADSTQLMMAVPPLRPKTDVYTADTGHPELLLNFEGPLPTVIGGTVYGIPIEMWVPKQYPVSAPIVYVRPTTSMLIQPGRYVDANGRVHFSWAPHNTLLSLVTMFMEIFSAECPVYTRSAPAYSATPSHPGSSGSGHDLPGKQVSGHLDQVAPPRPTPGYHSHSQPVNIMDTDAAPDGEIPPLPPNPHKVDSLERLQLKLESTRQKIVDDEITEDIASLEHTSEVLSWLEHALDAEQHRLEQAITQADNNTSILAARIDEATKLTETARVEATKNREAEDLAFASTAADNTLLRAVATDQAISDTIGVLALALDRERIRVAVFLKYVRALAREQFMARALALKAA